MGNDDRRHAAFADQLAHQVHHRLLGGDVEPGRGFVGDQEFRIAGERDGDDHALAHAAGEFERIGVVARSRIADLHGFEGGNGFRLRVTTLRPAMLQQNVLDLLADLADRVERRARVLEDHRDLAPPDRPHHPLARPAQILPVPADLAGTDAAAGIEDAHQGVGGDGFARSRFADYAKRLAGAEIEGDAAHRLDRAATGAETDDQILDRKHDGLLRCGVWDRRCRADRHPSG